MAERIRTDLARTRPVPVAIVRRTVHRFDQRPEMWSGGADGAAGQAWDAHPLDTAAVHPIGRKTPATPEDAPGVARG
ncbi:unannotated protein [freshwater metagenome]|uniref:Unannotated protein n=1 Tax=freshwater metagenome TaxID=449393 RepID=A0A6J7RWC5_9ZZZZ